MINLDNDELWVMNDELEVNNKLQERNGLIIIIKPFLLLSKVKIIV